MTVRDDLLKAAEIMDERGHCAGKFEAYDGRVCALGAIAIATGAGTAWGSSGIRSNRRAAAATEALVRHLGGEPDNYVTVFHYNDTLNFRAKQKMIKTFKKAAADLIT